MPSNNSDIKLRSEEVQEILSKMPHWTIRWGNLIILILLVLVLLFSYFIKYPDIVNAPVVVTTQNPPQQLIAKSAGRLEKILVSDKDTVRENTPIAVIENTANYKDVFLLKKICDTINYKSFEGEFKFPFEKLPYLDLGEIQQAYNIFEKNYTAYQLNKELKPFEVEKNYQSYESEYLVKRLNLLKSQRDFAEKELELKEKENERYQRLYNTGAISSQEWESKNMELIQAERNFQNILSQITQLESSRSNLAKNSATTEISELKDQTELSKNLYQSFSDLKNAIDSWELKYVFRSSIKGQVSFMGIWSENQIVNIGDFVFTVIPVNYKGFIGRVEANLQNSGKIKQGQKVNIHIDNYPDNEFGVLQGKIKSISLVPSAEGKLFINVDLPETLITSYGNKINFKQEMTGQADIVTQDLRLIERFFYQFRGMFRR